MFGMNEELDAAQRRAKSEGKHFTPLNDDQLIDYHIDHGKIDGLKAGDKLRLVKNNGNSKMADESMGMIFTVHRVLKDPLLDADGRPLLPYDFTALCHNAIGQVYEYPFNSAEFERV